MLPLGPVRLLPVINLNFEIALLSNKSLWRAYCLFVDHSSEYFSISHCAADLPLGSLSRTSQCHHPLIASGDVLKGDNLPFSPMN